MAKCPVCGMTVDEKKPAVTKEHQGQVFYFCSEGCKRIFLMEPQKYLKKLAH